MQSWTKLKDLKLQVSKVKWHLKNLQQRRIKVTATMLSLHFSGCF